MARPECDHPPPSRLCRGDDLAEGHRRSAGRRRRTARWRRLPTSPRNTPSTRLRVSHEQNLILPHVARADLKAVYDRLVEIGLATANSNLITDIIACPGLDYCALANARSIIGGAGDLEALRLAGAAARHRRTEAEDLRLHQRLRPSPCRPYRHSRRREEGRRALPGHARRLRRREHVDRRDHRPRLRPGRDHRRDRDRSSKPISACGSTVRKNSSTPIAASAPRRSRRRSMLANPRLLDGGAERVRAGGRPRSALSVELTPQEIIDPALEQEFTGGVAAVSSFGADSAVLLHMIAEIDRTLPVLFLDTGKHFEETLELSRCARRRSRPAQRRCPHHPAAAGTRARRSRRPRCTRPTPTPAATSARSSRWRAPSTPFGAWFTGRKRFQASTRAALPVFEAVGPSASASTRWPAGRHPTSPTTCARMMLRENPLVAYGYLSIGCFPCTQPVQPGEDARSGRWAGLAKTECGIHLPELERRWPAHRFRILHDSQQTWPRLATFSLVAQRASTHAGRAGYETKNWSICSPR